jgi:hypothetical protein
MSPIPHNILPDLLFLDFCLFTNRSYLCEPRAEQVEATEVKTQYIDVALGVLLSYGRRAHARLAISLYLTTAVTMFGRN